MIRTMAVIGTGLIGTSVALAASRRGVTVYLSDRNRTAVRTAAALGAGVARDPDEPVDLAVLAVPPSQVGTVLVEAQGRGLAHCYTDVASVKVAPEQAVLSRAPDPAQYIGGHPLAGRERSGPLAARADLFAGRPWALTPSPVTACTALDRALELVALCGATPVVLASHAHDEAVALTSHVPHLVASLMAAQLRDRPTDMARLAGPGLRDVTRIAHGDARLWSDILQANAAAIVGVVRDMHADLTRLVSALDILAAPAGADRVQGMSTVVELLNRGIGGVAKLPKVGPAAPSDGVRMWVAVCDHPGDLARLLGTTTDLGLAAEDAVVDIGEAGEFIVWFTVSRCTVDDTVAALGAKGWQAAREGNDARSRRRGG